MGNLKAPRTRKTIARANPIKHWIEPGRILPGEEEEAAILHSGFLKDFEPQGLIGQEVICDLVLNRLIRRRIDVAFTREFSRARAQDLTEWFDNRDRTAVRDSYCSRGPLERLRPELCIAQLESLVDRIASRGPEPDNDILALQRMYGDQPTEHAALAIHVLMRISLRQKPEDECTEKVDQEQLTTWVLTALECEIGQQQLRQEVADDVFDIECASDVREPRPAVLDALLRYRAANTREFKELLGALNRIRKLQCPETDGAMAITALKRT